MNAKQERRSTDHLEQDRMFYMLRFLSIVTAVVVITILAILAWWKFYPYEPIVTGPKPYRIVFPVDRVVVQGGIITYEFAYNKSSEVNPTITRQFVDGLVFNVAGTAQPTVSEIGTGTARVQVRVPETLPPGKYHLRVLATYQMNPIRDFHNDSNTEVFEVVSGRTTDNEFDALKSNREEDR